MNKKLGEILLKIILVWLFGCLLIYTWIQNTRGVAILEGEYSYTFENLENRAGIEKVWTVDVENTGIYNINVDIETESEGVAVGYTLYSEEGKTVDYGIKIKLLEEIQKVYLESGQYKFKVLILTKEDEIEDFLKAAEVSEAFVYEELTEYDDSVKVNLLYSIQPNMRDDLWTNILQWGIVIGNFGGLLLILMLCLDKKEERVTDAKNSYARVGMALAVFFILPLSFKATESFLGYLLFGEKYYELCNSALYFGIRYVFVLYVISLTSTFLLLQRAEKSEKMQHKMTCVQFGCCICMIMAIHTAGMHLTILFVNYILEPLGWKGEQFIEPDSLLMEMFLAVICAPVFEELLFRKLLIDRVRQYGEGVAILVSGLFFGLMHGTVSQTFTAAMGGFFLAYIYVRTGKIIYPILLHMFINIRGTVLDILSAEMPHMGFYHSFEVFINMLALAGLIMWVVNYKKLYLVKAPKQITEKKFRTVFGNFGLIIAIMVSMYMLIML